MNYQTTNVLHTLIVPGLLAAVLLSHNVRAEDAHGQHGTSKVSHAKELSQEFRIAAQKVSPSVVLVETLRGPRETLQWRMLRQQRASRANQPPHASQKPPHTSRDERGSGIIVDPSGVILTCNHVVAGADVIFVTLPDGRRFEPVQVFSDPDRDVAVLRIETDSELPAASLGNSDALQLGDWVVSVGNPYGLERSVSTGTVAATERNTPLNSTPLIQSDASSNPGSSGGALANLQGEIVGMLAGSIGVDDGFQGVGLAIPIKAAKQAAEKLMQKGATDGAYLGCDLQPIGPALARELELPKSGGLYVMYVADNTPAANAKLQVGDLITHFDDEPIDEQSPLRQVVDEPAPGEPHRMTVFRDGHTEEVSVVMDHRPNGQRPTKLIQRDHQHAPPQEFCERFGLGVVELHSESVQQLGYQPDATGVLITNVEIAGIAYKDGIAAGMIVLRINDHAIRNMDDFLRVTKELPPNKPVLTLIESPERRYLTVLGK